MSNHYTVLGVTRRASTDEIRAAYHKLALRHHPDKLEPDASDTDKTLHTAAFQTIQAAWDVLSDPDRKSIYDATLQSTASPPPASQPPTRPPPSFHPPRQRQYYQPTSFGYQTPGFNKRPSERPSHAFADDPRNAPSKPTPIQETPKLPPMAAAEAAFDNDSDRYDMALKDLFKKAKDWESRATRAPDAWHGEYGAHLTMLYRRLAENKEKKVQEQRDKVAKEKEKVVAKKKAKEEAEAKERGEGRTAAEKVMEEWESFNLPEMFLEDQLRRYEQKLGGAKTFYKQGYYEMKIRRFKELLRQDVGDDGFRGAEYAGVGDSMDVDAHSVPGVEFSGAVDTKGAGVSEQVASARVFFCLNSAAKRRRLN